MEIIIGAVISPVIAGAFYFGIEIYKNHKKQSERADVEKDRLDAICGKWEGTGTFYEKQEHGVMNFKITCQIERKGKIFRGSTNYTSDVTNLMHKIYDGSYDGRYLKMFFKSTNPAEYHQGYKVLRRSKKVNKNHYSLFYSSI